MITLWFSERTGTGFKSQVYKIPSLKDNACKKFLALYPLKPPISKIRSNLHPRIIEYKNNASSS